MAHIAYTKYNLQKAILGILRHYRKRGGCVIPLTLEIYKMKLFPQPLYEAVICRSRNLQSLEITQNEFACQLLVVPTSTSSAKIRIIKQEFFLCFT